MKRVLVALFASWTLPLTPAVADEFPAIVEYVERVGGAGPTFNLPFERYRGELRELPIGVFDSGIGGLTVLEAILKLDDHDNATGRPGADGLPDFQNERFIYLGDQANMPYGNYPAAGRTEFLRELIVRDAMFLLGDRYWPGDDAAAPRHDKPPVKAIVVACNTATAFGLDDLRHALDRWRIPIPIIGVVEAGGRGAIDAVRDDPSAGVIAVLATVGTCDSGAYPKAIANLAGRQGLPIPQVCQQGSLGLAGAIEGNPAFVFDAMARTDLGKAATANHSRGKRFMLRPELAAAYGFDPAGIELDADDQSSCRLGSVSNYIRYDATSLVDGYRRSGGTKPITTVVLGCTHFPLAAAEIEQALLRLRDFRDDEGALPFRPLIAEQLTVVDPGEHAAKQLFRELSLRELRLRGDERCIVDRDAFYATIPCPTTPNKGGFSDEYKYARSPGSFDVEDFRVVPIKGNAVLRAATEPWRDKLPLTASRMGDGR